MPPKYDRKVSMVPPQGRVVLYVGIDAGTHTGVSLWHPKELTLEVNTLKIHEAILMVTQKVEQLSPQSIHVRVEDSRQRRWFGEDRFGQKKKGAGSINRDSSIWHDMLQDINSRYPNVTYEMVAPKNNRTKVDELQFKILTGYRGSTSEHGRDAAMLVYGYGSNALPNIVTHE